MPKTIQIRNVPEALQRQPKLRLEGAAAGDRLEGRPPKGWGAARSTNWSRV